MTLVFLSQSRGFDISGISSCDRLVNKPGITSIYWLSDILARERDHAANFTCAYQLSHYF